MNRYKLVLVFLLLTATHPFVLAEQASSLELAGKLSEENAHAEAALEYRRLAMDNRTPSEQGSLYWMAGYEYLKASRYLQSDRMLTEVENTTSDLETEVYLLRSEHCRSRHRFQDAAFYLEGLTSPNRPEPVRILASKRLAATRLTMQDYDGARKALQSIRDPDTKEIEAIAAYERGSDKRPIVGGLLGLIPGLGYAYSGEYANGLRSLMLNALCIWGIVEFAEEEQWAGVAVVGFAEITFYTGSVYGGVDSAARYNDRRLLRSTRVIEGDTRISPDFDALPVLTLRYRF